MPVVNPASRLPVLRPVPIFLGLSRDRLFEVARKSVDVNYPPGTTVVRQGDPGDTLCIVVRGTLEVRRNDHVVGRLTAGDYFGEISLIDGEPRSATVVAIDDVELLELRSSDFESLLMIPYVSRVVMKNLTRLLRKAEGSEGPRPA